MEGSGLTDLVRRSMEKLWPRPRPAVESRGILAHVPVKGAPRAGLISQPATDHDARIPMARRLIEAYARARADAATARMAVPEDDLWTRLIQAELGPLLHILKSEDAEALSTYLLHFGEQYTWFGGLTLSVDGFTPQVPASSIAVSYLDKLVCLAESEGVLPLENPEQSKHFGENLYVDPDELLDALEGAIGIAVAPPAGVVPVTGLATRRGPLHYRHLNALYAALRIKALLPDRGAICEYGGGLGLVAYYAHQLGFAHYTIFDLPLISVFSGHFLLHTLGADTVRLYGEAEGERTVNVLPYWQCATVPEGTYSLALNQDSFPEIDPSLVAEYFRQIRRTTRGYFLSINQEAQAAMGSRHQNSVPALLRGNEGFHRVYRGKYWLREGYVEELYKLKS